MALGNICLYVMKPLKCRRISDDCVMKLPENVVIPREKLTEYLLVPQVKNDKSRFLAQAGFTQDNPQVLEAALRQMIHDEEAQIDRVNDYGTFYCLRGLLKGPQGYLKAISVWLHAAVDEQYRFITLKLDKE